MKIFSASVAILAGGSDAFNINPLHAKHLQIGNSATVAPTFVNHHHHRECLDRRRCTTSLCSSQSSSSNSKEESSNSFHHQQKEQIADTSRRALLRQCSSFFAATAFSSLSQQAQAAGFSESIDERYYYGPESNAPPIQSTPGPPQFSDSTVITPPKPQVVVEEKAPETVSPPTSVVQQQVTLENSQVVNIPQVPVESPTQFSQSSSASTAAQPKENTRIIDTRTTEQIKKGNAGIGEVSLVTLSLGAALSLFSGHVSPNTDDLSPKAKVVMITPEPYGLSTGRKYYNGVDVRINDPVPASDVRRYCDADKKGKVNSECVETINGFLDEVSKTPISEGQQETATAVLSYLDSLSSSSTSKRSPTPSTSNGSGGVSSETAVAFTSYLNSLSNGEINAPSNAQLVANYLNSISNLESRMNTLESSVNQLPDAISGRMEQWQMNQDEKLAREFMKIEDYLVKSNIDTCSSGINDIPPMPVNGGGVNGMNNGEGMELQTVFYNGDGEAMQ